MRPSKGTSGIAIGYLLLARRTRSAPLAPTGYKICRYISNQGILSLGQRGGLGRDPAQRLPQLGRPADDERALHPQQIPRQPVEPIDMSPQQHSALGLLDQ